MVNNVISKILLVEDESHLRETIRVYLEKKGYLCQAVSSGVYALAYLTTHSADLVISDVVMPDMDGIHLLKEAKKNLPDLDFIIMTGHTAKYTYSDIIAAGASDYMTKPFRLDELKARIGRVEREKRIMRELKTVNSQLKIAMQQAKDLAEKAELASLAKTEFLAAMSHEIRTPLNGIIGFIDILLETSLNKEQGDYAKTIKVSSEALLALINDILDSSKIEAGKMSLEKIEFDPEVLCYDVCELIRPRINEKPVEIVCRIGDTVPAKICGDPYRFRQVLLNLMGNATKFTEEGEIELSLDLRSETQDTITLITMVRDTGIGIQPHHMDLIFEPFQQAKGTMARKYGGTGLGLHICRKIAAIMGGEIWVESEPGTGSRFYFTAMMEKATDDAHKESSPLADLAEKQVLIIGASYNSLNILVQALKSQGMSVLSMGGNEDVPTALKKAHDRKQPFDFCIIDTSTMDMAGFDLAGHIRELPYPISETPLMALASPLPGCAKRCEKAGFDGFLAKPIRRDRLFQLVRQLIGTRKRTPSEAEKEERPILTQYSVRESMKQSVSILIAEDNMVNQQLAKVMLEKAGYKVAVAENGRQAVDQYIQNADAFDVILMDIQMPEMDGIDATLAIRHWEKESAAGTAPVPIIAVTANAMKQDRKRCLEAGMNDYLAKPIKREVVFDVINKWVLRQKK